MKSISYNDWLLVDVLLLVLVVVIGYWRNGGGA